MSNRLIPAAAAAILVASTISAQSFYMPSNTPAAGTCNVIPFGTTNTSTTWRNQKYQCMAKNAELGKLTVANICEIAFAPCGTGSGNYHFDTIEIVLAQTNASSLSSTFSTNVATNAKTVLKATNYDWNVTGGQWNRIGFDQPYLYISGRGANLVIQLTLTGNHKTGSVGTGFHRDSTHERKYAVGWTGSPPATANTSTSMAALKFEVAVQMNDLHTFGVGCKGSNGVPTLTLTGSAKIGQSLAYNLTNAPAKAPVYHVFGLKRTEPRLDLAFAGAPSCYIYESIDALLAVTSDASGAYSRKVSVPNNKSLLCLKVYTQFFPFDKINSFGLTASNYGRILIGN